MINKNIPENIDSQTVLNQIVLEYLRETKRKNFWRWVKRVFYIIVIIFFIYQLLANWLTEEKAKAKDHVGIIDINGTIFDNQTASADNFIKGFSKAYESKGLKAVILRINSPGGSAVQANYIYNVINFYRNKHKDIKIYAVCSDMCASAAYYIAAAADEIYADPASMVGSIGVLYNGFGFVDVMKKVGISRRLQTAGRNKGFMDPFSPETPEQQKYLQTILDEVHELFIDRVKQGRGKRLVINNDIFSGLFWTGIQAKQLGLIDGFGSAGQVARNIIKQEEVIDYTYQPTVLEKVAKNIGTAMVDEVPNALGMKPGLQ